MYIIHTTFRLCASGVSANQSFKAANITSVKANILSHTECNHMQLKELDIRTEEDYIYARLANCNAEIHYMAVWVGNRRKSWVDRLHKWLGME